MAVLAALAVAGTVRADLMPAAFAPGLVCQETSPCATAGADQSGSGEQETHKLRVEEGGSTLSPSHLSTFLPPYVLTLSGSGLTGAMPVESWLQRDAAGERRGGGPALQILSDRQGSLALCLYGLLGFGAFRSLSCMKKLSFDFVPHWYHSGAPAQIGHSYVIAPDCLCSTQVCCFVQPQGGADDLPLADDGGTLLPLLRESLFTPAVLGPRPPPPLTAQP